MLFALNWSLVGLLLAFWSLAAWVMHGLAVWLVSQAGAVPDVAAMQALQLPAWLAVWIPPEVMSVFTALAGSLGPMLQSLLQAMPSLAGLLTVIAWGVWGLGTLLLLALGGAGHAAIWMWRRHSGGGPRPPSTALQAG